MARHWIEFEVRRVEVDVPDDIDGSELEKALQKAADETDVDSLVTQWFSGTVNSKGQHVQ